MPKGVYKRDRPVWNKGKRGEYKMWPNGRVFTEEWKKKISVANRRNAEKRIGVRRPAFSDEWRRKIGDGNRGKKMSEKAKEKIRNGLVFGAENPTTRAVLRRKEEKAGRKRPESCELCGSFSRRICFDHDHETGKFRGWICHRCNATLGFVEDSEELLQRMIEYLRIAKKNSDQSF